MPYLLFRWYSGLEGINWLCRLHRIFNSGGFGFFLLYWASLIGGEKLADRGLLSPWVGMWMADIFLGILGAYLTLRMARETPTINWDALGRFIPQYFRGAEPAEARTDL